MKKEIRAALTNEQAKKINKLLKREDAIVSGIKKTKTNEDVIIVLNIYHDNVDETLSIPFNDFLGFSVYAVPLTKLNSTEDVFLSSFPYATFSLMPSKHGTFAQENIKKHIDERFSDYDDENLYCYELENIVVPDDLQSIGIGTLLLDVAKKEIKCQNLDSRNDYIEEIVTHIHAEMASYEDEQYDDLIRFYEKNGFVSKNHPFVGYLLY